MLPEAEAKVYFCMLAAMGKYRTVVADPPWSFRSAATKADARKHYETMTLGQIEHLPVWEMATLDAHLWLWAVNGLMEEAFAVVRAWGFAPVTLLTWCKPKPGVGYYLRNNTEHAILATRGKALVPADKAMSSWFEWPVGGHSAKPEAFFDLVEQVSPGPYLELFARRARIGWHYWGNESLGTAEMPSISGSRSEPRRRSPCSGAL